MNNAKTVNLHGMTGYGPTAKKALEDAQERIRRALTGDYDPIVVVAPTSGEIAVIYRDPIGGWTRQIYDRAGTLVSDSMGYGHDIDRAGIERSVRQDLAQRTFKLDGPTGLDVLVDPVGHRTHMDWMQWQYRYRAWHEHGADNPQARTMANDGQWPPGVPLWTPEGEP
ncbi:MAG: hypothetical protein KKA73_09330 [Chloroflexi bacterium]|nr:hypothetical protein [Chloroflexota bacterium]